MQTCITRLTVDMCTCEIKAPYVCTHILRFHKRDCASSWSPYCARKVLRSPGVCSGREWRRFQHPFCTSTGHMSEGYVRCTVITHHQTVHYSASTVFAGTHRNEAQHTSGTWRVEVVVVIAGDEVRRDTWGVCFSMASG